MIGLFFFLFLFVEGRAACQCDKKKFSHSTEAITVGYQHSLGSFSLQQKTHNSERTSVSVITSGLT